MELLALEGKIKEKIYGKQKIYFADQVSLTTEMLLLERRHGKYKLFI